MKTVILSQRYSHDSRLIESTATSEGYTTYRIQGTQFPDALKEVALLVYCEGFMAEYVSQQLNVVLLRPEIDALAKVDQSLLHRRVTFCQKAALMPFSQPTFVKPADQKFFQAGVYHSIDEIVGLDECPDDDPIFMSDVVDFVEEYRFFCLDGAVLTGSIYLKAGEFIGDDRALPEPSADLWDFANRILQAVGGMVPPGVVVDVGVLADGRFALIEFNPVWASGIYGCDPVQVLSVLEGACFMRSEMPPNLAKYEIF